MQRISILALAIFTSLGCGDDGPNQPAESAENTPSDAATYYQDVKPIVDAHCTECHVEGGIAPFALTTYEEVRQAATLVKAAVESREMPPMPAAPAALPFKYDTSLSDEKITTIASWVDGETPEGDASSPGEAIVLERRELSRVDLALGMEEPYTPTQQPDEYRCFVIDWPETDQKFITGFNIKPGNLAVAHHAALYLIGPDQAATVDEANGADGKDGYSCFGGANPPGSPPLPTKLVGGWGPGMEAGDFAEDTGILVEPGSRMVLQMHYSILSEGAQPDQSEIEFKISDEVEKSAGFLPFLDIRWPTQSESMLIPAGSANTAHEYVAYPGDWPLIDEFVPGIDVSEGIVIHSVLPHMHKLGKSISIDLERADGTTQRIFEIKDRWDFDWQLSYDLVDTVLVQPEDKLRLRCEWDNSATNQPMVDGQRRTPQDVTFGEGTYDEMCAGTIYITGVAEGSTECLGSELADAGKFLVTFVADDTVRDDSNLEGELRGIVRGSVYHADEVKLTGPVDGAEELASFEFEIDVTEGADGPYLIDAELPAGDYQLLGYLDTDENYDPENPGPDLYDPIMIPVTPYTLQCAEESVEARFRLLLPNL